MVVEVIPGLLLGSMSDVIAMLGGRMPSNITHLLSIINNPIDWSQIRTPQGTLMAKCISIPDLPTSDLLSHFPVCFEFIDECLQEEKKILVHCEHGISRSATIVLAYLMKKRKMTFAKCLTFLTDKKPDIRPNLGFQEQLKLWEIMEYKLNNTHKLYRAYTLHNEAQAMKRNGYMKSMQLAPNPSESVLNHHTSVYKCKKCRHVLLSSESVIQHEPGIGESAFHHRNRHGDTSRYFVLNDAMKKEQQQHREQECDVVTTNPQQGQEEHIKGKELPVDDTSDDVSSLNNGSDILKELSTLRSKVSSLQATQSLGHTHSCSSLFVEPVEWMGPLILGHKDGKLSCPKCSSRIGSFDWSGSQCSCGKWITPTFKIVKSKVDSIYR